jgi:UDP-N-acetylmuramate dehydrogenase
MFTPNADLTALNTFGLPGRARWLAVIDSLEGLRQAIAAPQFAQARRRLVLGGGSNVLLTGDFDGCVICPRLRGIEVMGERGDAILVRVAAGEPWHDTVQRLLAMGLPGLENLALIPGTVGAAPIQNIGAYGLELAQRFDSLEALDVHTLQVRRFSREDCQFAYRHSVFKSQPDLYIITHVTLALPRVWQPVMHYADVARGLAERGIDAPTAQDIFDVVVATRRAKLPDPAVLGNAGSFFKNPVLDAQTALHLLAQHPNMPQHRETDGRVKLAAAWLIDKCGFKGFRDGTVGVHERQALVLVNHGGATGAQVLALARRIQDAVLARFGVVLEPEPIIV